MSMCYWVCQGIGVEQSVMLPLLDGDRLKGLFDDVTEDEWEEDYEFNTLSNDLKIEAIIERCDEEGFNYELLELLQRRDSKSVLSCGNDNDGQYFLLYHPRYPWEESGGFASQEEVVKYIYDLLRPFCRDDVSEKDLFDVIDVDIYANGCS